jgi:molybdopterin molybdotransferase
LKPSTPSRIVSFVEANRIVREHADLLGRHVIQSHQTVPLLQSLGRTLADPVHADRDQPPFARSTRDGFGCRATELNAGHRLRITGQLRAGGAPIPIEIAEGEAVEIMTGAPVPNGADCVVMIEHVEEKEGTVRLLPERAPIAPGSNIVAAGSEARTGEVILPAGTRMAAAQIAAAAACGSIKVSVLARPRVAIIATGDELIELGEQPLPYQIRNSNSYSLTAQILTAGAEPVRLAIARDDAAHLKTLIRSGLEADLLLLSGGVSMGKYDLVEQVLLGMGAEFFFTGALIQPGKPIVFGRFPEADRPRYFFGLPGNPVSTMVTFLLFVEPFLAAHGVQPTSRFAQAKLKTELHTKRGLTRFLPATLCLESGRADGAQSTFQPMVETIPWQGSGDLAATSRANCFLVVPPDREVLSPDETVTVLL